MTRPAVALPLCPERRSYKSCDPVTYQLEALKGIRGAFGKYRDGIVLSCSNQEVLHQEYLATWLADPNALAPAVATSLHIQAATVVWDFLEPHTLFSLVNAMFRPTQDCRQFLVGRLDGECDKEPSSEASPDTEVSGA